MKTTYAINLFLRARRAKGLSRQALRWYKGILDHFAILFPDLPSKPEAIDDFLLSCRGGDERRHGYYRTMRALYRFLHRRYQVKNVMEVVDPPIRAKKLPRPLTLDELDQLISFPLATRITAAITFLADSGARVGEAARLDPADIMETEWGMIARVTGKTGTRFVPISPSTYHILQKHLPFRLSANRLSRLIAAAFREARVRGTAHNLRHTFATYWEGDELTLKAIMGHAHLSTTEGYRKLRTRKMSEQHREYSPLRLIMASRQLPLPLALDKAPPIKL